MNEPPDKKKKPKRHLFGTDGIRGIANQDPMTSEMALKLGRAIAKVLHDPVAQPTDGSGRGKPPSLVNVVGDGKEHRYKILIGKDTRLSGYMLETALASGICSMGGDVLLVGPLPTPGVAFLARSMRADAGVVISASHNPYEDNGIKFFSREAFKLEDETERRIEDLVFDDGALAHLRASAGEIGKAARIDDAIGRYLVFLKGCVPRALTFDGLKLVVDCANGAAYKVAPDALTELGADVVGLGVDPDGKNINLGCGTLHPEQLREAVLREGAQA